MDRPVCFLDACVLYPPLVRGILLGAAEAKLIRPRWSRRVLDEWRISALRRGAAEAGIDRSVAETAAAFPEAMTVPDPEVEAAISLPDPADAHVLAGAIAAGASVLVTFNLRDFPARRLAARGVAPRHPDGFLWELLSQAPEAMRPVIRSAAGRADAETPVEIRRALKRARLPRLGKAFEGLEDGPQGG
ncbi:MAG: PIN domain-containing protein [Paracoccaceae bacterium]|nr:PIN domain-containing protein [Paracoccaceae bacterium]